MMYVKCNTADCKINANPNMNGFCLNCYEKRKVTLCKSCNKLTKTLVQQFDKKICEKCGGKK
jgi:hypothetical protein